MCSVLYIICLFLCPFPFLPLYCLSYLNLRLTITSLVCSYFWKLFLTLCNVHNEGIYAYKDFYWFWHDTCIRKLRHIALVVRHICSHFCYQIYHFYSISNIPKRLYINENMIFVWKSIATHSSLRRRNKDWLAGYQDNASQRNDISTRGLLLQLSSYKYLIKE